MGTDDVAVQICYCIVFGFTIGIGLLSGTPIASGLYEKTGSLVWTFVLSGVMVLLVQLHFILDWNDQQLIS
ncbi:hypothetical protein HA402_008420 [Bradysia odoriphaga]|nr:hypothetical protein HA402_008420 [Bradysia odoriphaga]